MSFFDCMQEAMDDGHVDKERGRYAQDLWKAQADLYEKAGYNRHTAEAMAAEDVKASLKKDVIEKRHEYLQTMATLRDRELEARSLSAKQMAGHMSKMMETLDYEERGFRTYFVGRLDEFLIQHHPDLFGRITEPAQFYDVLRELHGESTGNKAAAALADSYRQVREEMRLAYNSAGGNIPKLGDWGLSHTHDWGSIQRAGFAKWSSDFRRSDGSSSIDWTRINDDLTGLPLQKEGMPEPRQEVQQRFLKGIFDNIMYGKGWKDVTYGRRARGLSIDGSRVLHFKTAEDWMRYNARYGQGSPFNAMMNQIGSFSRRIAEVKRLSVDPEAGLDFIHQVLINEAGKRDLGGGLAKEIDANATHATRMFKVLRGGVGPKGRKAQWAAAFFSTARHLMAAAFLDRSVIISSLSDSNLSRMAMKSLDINPGNMLATYGRLMKDSATGGGLTRDELRQQGWIAQSLANPNVSMDRFESDYPPHRVAQLLSSASMRIQGHLAHSDNLRMAIQHSIAAKWATEAGNAFDELPDALRGAMQEHGITAEDWNNFRGQGLFTAPNGGKFLNPLYWRHASDLPQHVIDRTFTKFQSFAERWAEVGVPGRNLEFSAHVDPRAYDLAPGSLPYEAMKSTFMFKSVISSMLVGQYRMMMMRPTAMGRALFAAEAAATDTLVGAMAIQINDVLMGRDPQSMNPKTHPMFMARAFVKGGALGPVGDILSQGTASWGGGIPSYVAGPMWQGAQDAFTLSQKTAAYIGAYALGGGYSKQRSGFAKEVAHLGARYMPMGQTPLLAGGAAMDRLIWDQLQMALDPNSVAAMVKKANKREKVYGQGEWWPDQFATPQRSPDFGTALR